MDDPHIQEGKLRFGGITIFHGVGQVHTGHKQPVVPQGEKAHDIDCQGTFHPGQQRHPGIGPAEAVGRIGKAAHGRGELGEFQASHVKQFIVIGAKSFLSAEFLDEIIR